MAEGFVILPRDYEDRVYLIRLQELIILRVYCAATTIVLGGIIIGYIFTG